MKASVLLKALEAYGDLDVCVIKETGPYVRNILVIASLCMTIWLERRTSND